jgi:dipeptidyl-peptidase 4
MRPMAPKASSFLQAVLLMTMTTLGSGCVPMQPETKTAQATPPPAPKISIEEVARFPRPGTSIPGRIAFSPDDAWVTYLFSEDGSLTRSLHGFEVATGQRKVLPKLAQAGISEENLTLEQKLQRERARERGLGVTRYAWAKKGSRMLVPLARVAYVQDGVDAEPSALTGDGAEPWLDPQLSPDGSQVGFVTDGALHVMDTATRKQRTLSKPREKGLVHGLAEYIAQEEMGRHHGFFWSRDGKRIAFTEVDERALPIYRIEHQGTNPPLAEEHAYPFAGADNAKVRLAVVPSSGGKPVWMKLESTDLVRTSEGGHYLARVDWLPDGGLLAQLQNRDQTRLDLVRFDAKTGNGTLVLSENAQTWINLHDMLQPLEKGEHAGGFIWASERSGFMHLYLYDAKGQLVRPLTSGEWMVENLVEVDEARQHIYFMATAHDPRERHLYRVDFQGGEPVRLTQEPGMHDVVIDHGFQRFVDTYQSLSVPPRVELRSLSDGSRIATLYGDADPRIAELGLTPPELVELESRDGAKLYGAIYRPAGGAKPAPVIVSVYGGPHNQTVLNSWNLTVDMRAQYLASLGYLVFKVDNRGSEGRGVAFEGRIKHDMGNVEVQDQVDGVKWLVGQGLADPARVGIYGWSYGGYMAAMSLARAPETFKVAVAGAPVTHWDGYDTHYTERYMGTPAGNPKGYQDSSVMAHIGDLRGKLLLVHGLIDENVHFRHTARLIDALIKQRKDYELLLFPNERHMPRAEEDRVYMEQRVSDFLTEHLKVAPPA